MERVVNIIGMGASAKTRPDTGENWGINYSYVFGEMDKLFFMDGPAIIETNDHRIKLNYGISFHEAIAKYPNMELISKNLFQEKLLGSEKIINPFPLSDAVSLIPGGYFTSTFAYVIAYAILEKVDRIRLYGFEVWSGSDANEYQYQRPCIDFWLAFAMGRGIKVEVPYYLTQTSTNSQNFYGYCKNELNGRK